VHAIILLHLGLSLASATELKVLTYNVWGLPGRLIQKPERLAAIARVAPLLGADVIGFEETFNGITEVLARMKDYPHIVRGPGADRLRFSSGLLLVSRWPILSSAHISFSSCHGTDCFSQKGVVFARVQLPWGEVDFYLTHMNAAGGEAVRTQQLSELSIFMADHSPDGRYRRPVIVFGDFNFEAASANYNRMRQLTGTNDAHSDYVAANRDLPPVARNGYTSDPTRNSNQFGRLNPPKRIDFILYKSSTQNRLTVKTSSLAFDAPVDGMHLSDHFGVSVQFQVKH